MLYYKTYFNNAIKPLVFFISTMSITSYAADSSLWDMSLEDLGKIRVTTLASGTATPLDKAAAIATVITAEDIEAMGANDISQVLETVPDLHVGISDQVFAPKYNIRGITSNRNAQTLMLINGIPITNLFTGNRGQIWMGMPVKGIARIEIIRGPGSALYGADAFAGVINIITKNADDIAGTQTGAGIGNFGQKSAWLQHGSRYGTKKMAFNLEAYKTNGWDSIVKSDAQTLNDQIFQTNASLAPNKVNTMKEVLEARFELTGLNDILRIGYQGNYNIGTGTGLIQALDPEGRYKAERFNVDYSYNFNELIQDWQIQTRTSFYRSTQQVEKNLLLFPRNFALSFDDNKTFFKYPDGFIGNPSLKEDHARFDLSGLFKGLDKHFIRVGTGFYWGDIFEVTESKNFYPNYTPRPNLTDVSDTKDAFLPEKERTNYYAFGQDEWQIANTLQLTTGLRYDYFSDFGSTINPRLALIWANTPDITTKLLYGRAFRAPSISELFVDNNPVQNGNPNLKPEIIDTYELALSHQVSDNLLYNTNIYYYKIKDYITLVPINAFANQMQNSGKRHGHGLSAEVDYSALDNLRLVANYSYQLSKDDATKTASGDNPNHQLYLRGEWEITPAWLLSPQVNVIGQQKRAAGDIRPPVASYSTVDISLRKKHYSQPLSFAVSVHNLFNADVRESSPAAVADDYPMAKRSLMAEVNYQF